jgi:D-alanyl-D-alanine carboxypeptidase
MVAEKASGKPFRDLVHELVIEPFGLHSTFYESGTYPKSVVQRLAHEYFENPACNDYQPKDCQQSWNLPLVGRDVRTMSSSWAQAAGGAIANARDIDRWMRAVFAGKVMPRQQQAEWLRMVSTRTGAPLAEVSSEDPRGFSLGLARGILGSAGPHWFYQGETLGFRTLYAWFSEDVILITVQTNSQPADGMDRLHDAVTATYEAVKPPASP